MRLLFLLFVTPLFGYLNGPGDTQLWAKTRIRGALSERGYINFEEEFRFGDDLNTFWYNHGEVDIGYTNKRNTSLDVGYRQVWRRVSTSSIWYPQYTPVAECSFFTATQYWKLSSRTRAEYRIIPKTYGDTNCLLRQRFQITPPLYLYSKALVPYVSEEIFYQINEGFNENRLSICISTPQTLMVSLEAFYMLRTIKNPHWYSMNVFGCSLYFTF